MNIWALIVGAWCLIISFIPDPATPFLGIIPWQAVNYTLLVMGFVTLAIAFFVRPN